ncbi:MAG TPA: hypothetical protein VGM84_05475 [Steroidobacteraceae bacterium]
MDTLIRNIPSRVSRAALLGTVATVLFSNIGTVSAGPAEIAARMHNRIAGVPPSATVLSQMVTMVQANDLNGAALLATQNPNFYNVQLKTFVTPWTNRDQTVFAPLNDYTATVIGMVRDDLDFSTALSDDILYTVNSSGLPAPSISGNDHYATAETNGVDLSTTLKRTTQSATYGLPVAATAGLMTTRGGASAFFVAGTNRAMFRFTMMNHLCHDMEAVQDTTRPSDRIRQDVARSPGGDSRIFLNNCVGCHSGMDPMAQAFAYYNFDATSGALQYTANMVQPKYLINSDNFKQGFVTPNDAWENRWRAGPNAVLGFSGSLPGSGNGAKSLGQELAASDAFAQCQVTKVFQAVCFRAPQTQNDLNAIAATKASFKSGYNLRKVFAATAAYCSGS